jgi:hypothetical protein
MLNAAFIAHAILTGEHSVRRAFEQTHPLAVDLFGVDGVSTKDGDWRHNGGCLERHYLKYLDTLGYQLSSVDRVAAGLDTVKID